MPRRSNGLITLAARLPWWATLLLGLAMYAFVGHSLPQTLEGPFAPALEPVFRLASYVLAGACVIGALLGLAVRLKQRRLYGKQRSIDQIRSLSWRDFEHLMAEAFRREGFNANLTEPGPDGGVDLVLRRNDERWLVQCKQWRNQRVGVKPVRELAGVAAATRATGAIFVCSGDYTKEAREFADRAHMRLIDGPTLARMMEIEPGMQSQNAASLVCPSCGNGLVERVARRGPRSGTTFLGCSSFPQCQFTRGI